MTPLVVQQIATEALVQLLLGTSQREALEHYLTLAFVAGQRAAQNSEEQMK